MLEYLKIMLDAKRSEEGATAVEYGLLVALIAAFIITIVTTLGTEIRGAFNDIVSGLGGTPDNS